MAELNITIDTTDAKTELKALVVYAKTKAAKIQDAFNDIKLNIFGKGTGFEKLKKSVTDVKNETETLVKTYKKVEQAQDACSASIKENSASFKKSTDSINQVHQSLIKLEQQQKKTADLSRTLKKSQNELSSTLARFNPLVRESISNSVRATATTKTQASQVAALAAYYKTLNAGLANVNATMQRSAVISASIGAKGAMVPIIDPKNFQTVDSSLTNILKTSQQLRGASYLPAITPDSKQFITTSNTMTDMVRTAIKLEKAGSPQFLDPNKQLLLTDGIKKSNTEYEKLISSYRAGKTHVHAFEEQMSQLWQKGTIPDKEFANWKRHTDNVRTAQTYMDKYGLSTQKMGVAAKKAWGLSREESTLLNKALVAHRADIDAAGSAYGRLHTEVKKIHEKGQLMNKMWARFSVYMSGIAATIFVFQNVVRLLSQLITHAMGFEKTLDNMQQKFDLTRTEIMLLGEAAREFGKYTTMSAQDAIKKINELMASGKSAAEALKQIRLDWIKKENIDHIHSLDDAMKMLQSTIAEINFTIFDKYGESIKENIGKAAKWIDKHQESLYKMLEALVKLGVTIANLTVLMTNAIRMFSKLTGYQQIADALGVLLVAVTDLTGGFAKFLDQFMQHPLDTLGNLFFGPSQEEIERQEEMNRLKEIEIALIEQNARIQATMAKYSEDTFVKRYNAIDQYVQKWTTSHEDLKKANFVLYNAMLQDAKKYFTQVYDLRISNEEEIQEILNAIYDETYRTLFENTIITVKAKYKEQLSVVKQYSSDHVKIMKDMYKDILEEFKEYQKRMDAAKIETTKISKDFEEDPYVKRHRAIEKELNEWKKLHADLYRESDLTFVKKWEDEINTAITSLYDTIHKNEPKIRRAIEEFPNPWSIFFWEDTPRDLIEDEIRSIRDRFDKLLQTIKRPSKEYTETVKEMYQEIANAIKEGKKVLKKELDDRFEITSKDLIIAKKMEEHFLPDFVASFNVDDEMEIVKRGYLEAFDRIYSSILKKAPKFAKDLKEIHSKGFDTVWYSTAETGKAVVKAYEKINDQIIEAVLGRKYNEINKAYEGQLNKERLFSKAYVKIVKERDKEVVDALQKAMSTEKNVVNANQQAKETIREKNAEITNERLRKEAAERIVIIYNEYDKKFQAINDLTGEYEELLKKRNKEINEVLSGAIKGSDAIEKVNVSLKAEIDMLQMSELEKETYQQIQKTGIELSKDEIKVIGDLVKKLFELRAAKKYKETINGLTEEIKLLKMSEVERRTYQEIQKAGVALTSNEADRIKELVAQLFDLKKAFENLSKTNPWFMLIRGAEEADDAIKKMRFLYQQEKNIRAQYTDADIENMADAYFKGNFDVAKAAIDQIVEYRVKKIEEDYDAAVTNKQKLRELDAKHAKDMSEELSKFTNEDYKQLILLQTDLYQQSQMEKLGATKTGSDEAVAIIKDTYDHMLEIVKEGLKNQKDAEKWLESEKKKLYKEDTDFQLKELEKQYKNYVKIYGDIFSEISRRIDGTIKSMGFLGPLLSSDNMIMTEYSIGVKINGKEVEIPSLVPTLTEEEVQYILFGGKITDAMVQKAVDFATERINKGISPFASIWETDLSDQNKILEKYGVKNAKGLIEAYRVYMQTRHDIMIHYWDEHDAFLDKEEKENLAYYKKITGEEEKFCKDKLSAMKSLYEDLEEISGNYFEAQVELIEYEYEEYLKSLGLKLDEMEKWTEKDKALYDALVRWKINKTAEEYIKLLKSTGDYIDGVKAYLLQAKLDWQDYYKKIGDYAYNTMETMSDGLKGMLSSALQVEYEEVEDKWDNLLDNMLDEFTDFIADLIVEWAKVQLADLVFGVSGSGSSGTTTAAQIAAIISGNGTSSGGSALGNIASLFSSGYQAASGNSLLAGFTSFIQAASISSQYGIPLAQAQGWITASQGGYFSGMGAGAAGASALGLGTGVAGGIGSIASVGGVSTIGAMGGGVLAGSAVATGVTTVTGALSALAAAAPYAAAALAACVIYMKIMGNQNLPDARGYMGATVGLSDSDKYLFSAINAEYSAEGFSDEDAQKEIERITKEVGNTFSMYEEIWSYLSKESQAALKESLEEIDWENIKLHFFTIATEGAPMYSWMETLFDLDEVWSSETQDKFKSAVFDFFDSEEGYVADLYKTLQEGKESGSWVAATSAFEEIIGKLDIPAELIDVITGMWQNYSGPGMEDLYQSFQDAIGSGSLQDLSTDEIAELFWEHVNSMISSIATSTAGSSYVAAGNLPNAGVVHELLRDYFTAYVEEGITNMKASDIYQYMSDEVRDNFAQLTAELFAEDIEEFYRIYGESAAKLAKAQRIWDVLENLGEGYEYSYGDKLSAMASAWGEAYKTIMETSGVEISDTDLAELVKEYYETLASGTEDLDRAVMGITDLDMAVGALNGTFDAYIKQLEELGVTAEGLIEIEKLRAAAMSKLLEDYKHSLGLISDEEYYTAIIDKIMGFYSDYFSSTQELIDWFTTASVEDLQALAEKFGLDWNDIANDVTWLMQAIQALGSAAEDVTESFEAWKASILGLEDEFVKSNIAERYGLAADQITEEFFKDVLEKLRSMTEDEFAAWAAGLGVSVNQLKSDIASLGAIFNSLGTAISATADKIMDIINSIRSDISGGSGGGGATTAAGLMGQILGIQSALPGDVSSGDTTLEGAMESLLTMSELLADWYETAIDELNAQAQADYEAAREDLEARRDILNEELRVAQAFGNLVDTIFDTINSIKYSALNVNVPRVKAIEAKFDYETLKAAAIASGSIEDYQKFVGFAQTALQQYQNEYQSGEKYQAFYAQVMADLKAAGEVAEAKSYDEAILAQLEAIEIALDTLEVVVDSAALAALEKDFEDIAKWIEDALGTIQQLNMILTLDWDNYDGSIEDALAMLTALVNVYGWENTIILEFVGDMAQWLAEKGNIADMITVMDTIASKSGDWNSEVSLTFLAALGGSISDWTTAQALLDHLINEAGLDWSDPAVLTMVAAISTNTKVINSFESAGKMLAYLIDSVGGDWTADAILTFVAGVAQNADVIDSFKSATDALDFLVNAVGGDWSSPAVLRFIAGLKANEKLSDYESGEALIKYIVEKMGGTWDPDLYVNLKGQLASGSGSILDTVDQWLADLGLSSNSTITRSISIQLLYNMLVSGEMDQAQLAQAVNNEVIAGYISYMNGDYADYDNRFSFAEGLGALFGNNSASDLGYAVGFWLSSAISDWGKEQDAAQGALNYKQAWADCHRTAYWAEGGIATQPTWGVFGEAGPEAFLRLADNRYVATSFSDGGSNRPIEINLAIELDGEPLYGKVRIIARDESETHRVNLVRANSLNERRRQPV